MESRCPFLSQLLRLLAFTGSLTGGIAFVPRLTTIRVTSSLSLVSRFTPPPPLVPEENPEFDPHAKSLAGVSYNDVLAGLHRLYPPSDLEKRNALSRTDGYWPYIQKGEDPPIELTYGEFDFYFFAQLIDKSRMLLQQRDPSLSDPHQRISFCDVGSGTGRLVLAAAALHPDFQVCRGLELLEKIHGSAVETLQSCRTVSIDDNNKSDKFVLTVSSHQSSERSTIELPMAPIEFLCGSLDDPYIYFGDVDLIFCFAACMGPDVLAKLAENIGRQCRPGTIILTTELMLPLHGEVSIVDNDARVPGGDPFELELVERVEGWCWLTGGASTVFIHRVTKSLWQPTQGPIR